MTVAEALADRRVIYRIAASAEADPRTVISALRGKSGKGNVHRRIMEAISAEGISSDSKPPQATALKSV